MDKPKLKVKSQGVPDLSSVKRCYLPGAILESDCSHCGKSAIVDFGDDYIMYPQQNSTHTLTFYCEACEDEWELSYAVTFSAKLVPSA